MSKQIKKECVFEDQCVAHGAKPDLDNLQKAVMDAITNVGIWKDDALVFKVEAEKWYCADNIGAQIIIEAYRLKENCMKTVQNEKPAVEDVQPIIDEKIVDTVFDIFGAVTRLNLLQDCFEDLANRLIADLTANSFMEYNLELKEDQKEQLRKVVKAKGNETVRDYLAKVNTDDRTKAIYGVVREKITGIIDSVLSSIGQEINRGAIINAIAVQANAKSEEYDEILLRKTKTSGDITIPTNCLLISTNCVSVFKASCQEEKKIKKKQPGEKKEIEKQRAAADKPMRRSKK
jgi:hypothetical protein